MIKFVLKYLRILVFGLFAGLFLAACGGGGDGGSDFGTLKTSLTDASTDQYQAIYVTIDRVDVHMGDEGEGDMGEGMWETVAEPQTTYNLLELVNGVRETLGIASLAAGHYTQMRLIIGSTPDGGVNLLSQAHPFANYLVEADGSIQPLTTPSGQQTGWKIVGGFDISAGETTELILDFDAMRSVVKAGNSGKYLLKPTVKVLNTMEYAVVSGSVFYNSVTVNSATLMPVAGAMVTAQTIYNSAVDPKDEVVIASGTVSEDNGQYALFLKPDSYNLVATAASYNAACLSRDLMTGEIASMTDFILTAEAQTGTVNGLVDLGAGSAADQYATIDFRQELSCVDEAEVANPTLVTVKTFNIADMEPYSIELPAGDYQVVASSFGLTTETYNVAVLYNTATTLNITLNPTP